MLFGGSAAISAVQKEDASRFCWKQKISKFAGTVWQKLSSKFSGPSPLNARQSAWSNVPSSDELSGLQGPPSCRPQLNPSGAARSAHQTNETNQLFVVRVDNLAKVTTEEDLAELVGGFPIYSIYVINSEPCNYGIIRCLNLDTAHEVEEVLYRRNLHNNTLTARISVEHSNDYTTKDLFTVKIFIYYSQLSQGDLDAFFMGYGSTCGQAYVRCGSPDYDYAYLSFYDPFCAHDVCNDSPHTISGVQVVATPKNWIVSSWYGLRIDCDPLVSELVMKELLQYQDFMRVSVDNGTFKVQVDKIIKSFTKEKLQTTIRKYESGIVCEELNFDSYYFPILTDPATKTKLARADVLSFIEVSLKSAIVPLKNLNDNHFACGQCASHHHQWYWFDDDTFQPYSTEVNKHIEESIFKKDEVEVDIGCFSYCIDTILMIQTNKSTLTQRPLKRISVFSEVPHVTLCVNAYKDCINGICDKFMDIMDNSVTKLSVILPREVLPFRLVLLEAAQRTFVKASLSKGRDGEEVVILLQGKQNHVQSVNGDLSKKMLAYHPPYWSFQFCNCEAKSVSQNSEKDIVLDILHQQSFRCEVHKIVRIQNTQLWKAFTLQRKWIYVKNNGKLNEHFLFHGTRSVNPEDIYGSERGFDPCLSRQGLLGRGSYFAERLEYSHNYAYKLPNGLFQVFLARVITGISCPLEKEDRSLTSPPLKDGSGKIYCYDSTTAITTTGSRIYSVYELHRAYPEYLITYKMLST